jgi:hypothetical protein
VTSAAPGTLDRLRGADFLDNTQLESEQLRSFLDLAGEMRARRRMGAPPAGRHAMASTAPTFAGQDGRDG